MSLYDNLPHVANYKMAVWPAPMLLSGVVTGTPARGDRSITITPDFTLTGTIHAGYTLETDADAGTTRPTIRTRIRSYGANVFTIAENAIDWDVGDVVRVYKEILPWSIKPRIMVVSGTPVFLQDYDIAYSNQNQITKPVVCMGPHFAGPIGSRVYWTSAGSFDPQGSALSTYSWVFAGGTPGTSSAAVPGYVTYNTPGLHLNICTITTAAGGSATGYRFINIGQPEHTDYSIESLENKVDGSTTLKGWSRTTFNGTLKAGALVVVYGEEKYGGVLCLESEATNRAETKFVGYIKQRSVRWNARFDRWDFEAVGITTYADMLDVYDTSLQFRETSNRWQWWKYYRLTADQAIIWHLRWHTNILDIADFVKTSDTLFVKNVDIGRGGPFSSIRQFLSSARPGWIGNTYQGRIHVTTDPNLLNLNDRPDVSWFTLNENMVREEPHATDMDPPTVSHSGAGGFAFTGATGTSTAFLSAAPMEAADNYGRPNDLQGLILNPVNGQDGLNAIAGHIYARDNNEWADTTWPLIGDFRPYVDVFPIKKVLVNSPGDPVDWVNEAFYVKGVTHKYNSATHVMLTDLNLARHTVGIPGVTIPIPVPEQEDPPIPPPVIPPVIPPTTTGNIKGVVMGVRHGASLTSYSFVYAGDVSVSSQPTYTFLTKPSNYSTFPPVVGTYDHAIHVSSDGSRLFACGTRTGDNRNTIWECTNWTSIKSNPTPPSPTWVERVVYAVTTVGGSTVNLVGTLTAGNLAFTSDNIAHITCKLGATYSLVHIALDGTLSGTTVTSSNTSFGISSNVYNDISGISGNSFVRDNTGASLYTWNDSRFGTGETSSPYRNEVDGPAITSFVLDSGTLPLIIKSSGSTFTLADPNANGRVIFGGNPDGQTVFATINNADTIWRSINGGVSWSVFATWHWSKVVPLTSGDDTSGGAIALAYSTISNGSVPIRLYNYDGSVLSEATGNWWTGLFTPSATTVILCAKAWYV